jgi:hypothetical protein
LLRVANVPPRRLPKKKIWPIDSTAGATFRNIDGTCHEIVVLITTNRLEISAMRDNYDCAVAESFIADEG